MAQRLHSDKHERRDLGAGGRDPLDIYTRAVINLRAREQETPGMTVYVDYGFYNNGSVKWWEGGSSGTFTAPTSAGMQRWDLLYLNSSDALAITTGTEVGILQTPAWPSAPLNCLPIAFVLLTGSTTTITESIIRDARVLWQGNQMTPALHSDHAAVYIVAMQDENTDILTDEDFTISWSE